jgi:hypothetical protein
MGKLATPDWVKEGFDSKADWEKKHKISGKKKSTKEEKVFKLRICPKCGSDDVQIVLSNLDSEDVEDEDSISDGKEVGEWECKKCKWHGKNVKEEELTEDEFMKYLDEQGVDLP